MRFPRRFSEYDLILLNIDLILDHGDLPSRLIAMRNEVKTVSNTVPPLTQPAIRYSTPTSYIKKT